MASQEGHQEHDLTVYWYMWIALFVLSAGSYATDFMDRGVVRHTLIILFMLVKAGGIVAVFMHMWWERLALKLAVLVPCVFIGVFIWLMAFEGEYTWLTRIEFFGESTFVPQEVHH